MAFKKGEIIFYTEIWDQTDKGGGAKTIFQPGQINFGLKFKGKFEISWGAAAHYLP